MLSARQRYMMDSIALSPHKPKIKSGKLPQDFFQNSCSLKLKRSFELKPNKANQGPGTPMFGKRRPSPLILQRKVVTALEKHQNQQDQTLIRDVIFSSRNIRKLKKLSSLSMQRSKDIWQIQQNMYTPQLPPIKNRKVCIF